MILHYYTLIPFHPLFFIRYLTTTVDLCSGPFLSPFASLRSLLWYQRSVKVAATLLLDPPRRYHIQTESLGNRGRLSTLSRGLVTSHRGTHLRLRVWTDVVSPYLRQQFAVKGQYSKRGGRLCESCECMETCLQIYFQTTETWTQDDTWSAPGNGNPHSVCSTTMPHIYTDKENLKPLIGPLSTWEVSVLVSNDVEGLLSQNEFLNHLPFKQTILYTNI